MSEDTEERVTDADLRAGPVISAIENLANNRIREHDLEYGQGVCRLAAQVREITKRAGEVAHRPSPNALRAALRSAVIVRSKSFGRP